MVPQEKNLARAQRRRCWTRCAVSLGPAGPKAHPKSRSTKKKNFGRSKRGLTLDGQNRQSPIASVQRTRSTLASHSAVPRGTNVKRMNANRTRFESQRNERRVCEDSFLCFRGRYDRQRTLAIRIAAITLASDSALTITRFRPSKGLANGGLSSAPRMTGRRSHWTERGEDNIFFTFGHCGAIIPSLAANGLIVMAPSCVNSLYPSAEESWEEMTKIEPRNKMLYSPGCDQ